MASVDGLEHCTSGSHPHYASFISGLIVCCIDVYKACIVLLVSRKTCDGTLVPSCIHPTVVHALKAILVRMKAASMSRCGRLLGMLAPQQRWQHRPLVRNPGAGLHCSRSSYVLLLQQTMS